MINIERLCLGCMSDKGGEKNCPFCNFDNSTQNSQNSLPLKFVINNRYVIGKQLFADQEGITYIGWDNAKDSAVTIKEYFPSDVAHRNPDKTVSIVEGNEYTFNGGLLDFLEINSIIIESEFPSLMEIESVFEENGTAYYVSKTFSGITLKEFLEKNGGTLKWEQARALFLPLIDTINGMNSNGVIHGRISDETILVGRDGKMRISGYGIRRLRTVSENSTSVLDGFGAIEQYDFKDMHIDTYTDVYGLCVTIFRTLIGNVPLKATLRVENDSMSIPSRFAEELPRHVLASLANGLQVMPENRTKDIETLKNQLVYGEIDTPVAKKQQDNETAPATSQKGNTAKYVMVSAICTVVVVLGIALLSIFTVFKDDVFGVKEPVNSDNSVSFDAPEVDQIGTVESGAEVSAKLYTVPNFKKKFYSEILDNEEYEMYKFVISDKTFSNECEKGTVVSQSVAAGTGVTRDTEIQLVLSLGPKEIKIANLEGLTKEEAELELLKQGFIYENIEVFEKYDEDKKPGTVLEQYPKYGESVSTDVGVKIYINSFEGDGENSSSLN